MASENYSDARGGYEFTKLDYPPPGLRGRSAPVEILNVIDGTDIISGNSVEVA